MEASGRKIIITLLLFLMILEKFHLIESTSPNLRTLSIQNCSFSDLKEIKGIEEISELFVTTCNLTTWSSGGLANYTNLSVLQIRESQFGILNDSTLDGLQRLRTVSLVENYINVIGRWSREPLMALNTLNLRRNNIQLLHNNSFKCYPNLQRLDLSGNQLETVNGTNFADLSYLNYLDMASNHLTHINNTPFNGLERLVYLNLSKNQISEISPSTFESSVHLHTLELQSNKLENIHFLRAESLKSLYTLNLSRNRISELLPNTFDHISHLKNLDLSWNRLTHLEDESLSGLKTLEHLNISHNRLRTVASSCFGVLGSLKEINLSWNNLSTIPAGLFKSTPLLQRINLAQNKLVAVSEMLFSPLPYLTYVNIAGNNLTNATFTEHFAAALQLSELTLNLNDNQLQDTALNMTKLVEFKRVELAGNHWSCLWLMNTMTSLPMSVHFGSIYETTTNAWSHDILDLTGIDCFDAKRNRSLIILQLSCNECPTQQGRDQRNFNNFNGATTMMPENPSPPPLTWPKIRLDKFDSRSVIIWMLIAIAIAFAGLRIARHVMDEKDRKKLLRKLKQQQSNVTELETLNQSGHKFKEWTRRSYEKLEKPQTKT